jgi:hypothetical protein
MPIGPSSPRFRAPPARCVPGGGVRAGAALQALFRNPLADPGLLGCRPQRPWRGLRSLSPVSALRCGWARSLALRLQ